jgi:hypothetical protein
MTITLGTTTTGLRHRVRLVHATTGAPIAPVALGPVELPVGWSARVVGPDVVITASTTDAGPAADPAPTVVDVIVLDGTLADHLALPPAAADQPPSSVRVTLGALHVQVPVDPVKMTLTVVLTAQGSTAASDGRTVEVRGASGATVALLESTTPGTYRSELRTWTSDHHPGDLRVNGQSVRKVAVDVTHADTRIHVVDPT